MRFVTFASILILLFSCTESSNEQAELTQEISNFYALTVGNSWVYKNYRYDQNDGTYVDTHIIDSISIVDTEEISGITFYKFRRYTSGNDINLNFCNQNGEYFELLRELDGNLIDNHGQGKIHK